MLTPARDRALRLVLMGCLISSCASGPAAAQDHVSDQDRSSQIDWGENFYGIRAEGSQGTRMEIRFEPGLEVRASAVLIQQTSTWTATTSQCPRLAAALEAFRRLPPLKPGPAALQPNLPAAIPVPPSAHGWGKLDNPDVSLCAELVEKPDRSARARRTLSLLGR